MTAARRILLVEDNRADAALVREMLAGVSSPRIEVHWVDRLAAAIESAERQRFDAVLLDLSLPDSHGLETIERFAGLPATPPVVVLTGSNDETVAMEAVQRGAQDYLVKGETDGRAMARAIQYAIDRRRAEQAIRKARDELEIRVRERTAELQAANEALAKRATQLRALASALTLAEQRERRRMAGILHDHLQQLLVAAQIRVKPFRKAKQASIRQDALAVDDLLARCIEACRSLTGELSPPGLKHQGRPRPRAGMAGPLDAREARAAGRPGR